MHKIYKYTIGMCPSVFHETNGKSAVHKQPITDEQILNALQAAVACPTGSIRTENKNSLASKASNSFPLPALDFHGKPVPNIYFNGFTSPHTFGALSWLLHTPKLTIMIDCPRFSTFLSRQIGHVDYLILTHRDDVHNHDKWASALNAKRIIRIDECNSMQKTDECEIKLRDVDFPFEITEGVTLIHVPGHTKGSISLIDEYSNSLFSGDHVFGSLDENITASKVYCSYSWDEQLRSVHSLSQFDIHHIWPGHGRPLHFECIEDAKQGFKKASIQLST